MTEIQLRSLEAELRAQHGLEWRYPRLAWPMEPHPDTGQPWILPQVISLLDERYRRRARIEQQFREQVASEAYQRRIQARVVEVSAQVGCEPDDIKEVWDQLTGGYPHLSLEAPDGTQFGLDGAQSRWTELTGYVLSPYEEDPYAEFRRMMRDEWNASADAGDTER